MIDSKRLEFFKERIKSILLQYKNELGDLRYRLYIEMVNQSDDYDELKEMADLEMQIDMLEYTRKSIKEPLEEKDVGLKDIKSVFNPNYKEQTNKDLVQNDIEDDIDSEETQELMAFRLRQRLSEAPEEERDRVYTPGERIGMSVNDSYEDDEEEDSEDDYFSEDDEETDGNEQSEIEDDDDEYFTDSEDSVEDSDEGSENEEDNEDDEYFIDEDNGEESEDDSEDTEDDDYFIDTDEDEQEDSSDNSEDEEDDYFVDDDTEESEDNSEDSDEEDDYFIDYTDESEESNEESEDSDEEDDYFVDDTDENSEGEDGYLSEDSDDEDSDDDYFIDDGDTEDDDDYFTDEAEDIDDYFPKNTNRKLGGFRGTGDSTRIKPGEQRITSGNVFISREASDKNRKTQDLFNKINKGNKIIFNKLSESGERVIKSDMFKLDNSEE